jgi:hypothetical protein
MRKSTPSESDATPESKHLLTPKPHATLKRLKILEVSVPDTPIEGYFEMVKVADRTRSLSFFF